MTFNQQTLNCPKCDGEFITCKEISHEEGNKIKITFKCDNCDGKERTLYLTFTDEQTLIHWQYAEE